MSTRSRSQDSVLSNVMLSWQLRIVKKWDQYEAISRMKDYDIVWFLGLKKKTGKQGACEEHGKPGLDSDLG